MTNTPNEIIQKALDGKREKMLTVHQCSSLRKSLKDNGIKVSARYTSLNSHYHFVVGSTAYQLSGRMLYVVGGAPC